jgi:hypothetical protein
MLGLIYEETNDLNRCSIRRLDFEVFLNFLQNMTMSGNQFRF